MSDNLMKQPESDKDNETCDIFKLFCERIKVYFHLRFQEVFQSIGEQQFREWCISVFKENIENHEVDIPYEIMDVRFRAVLKEVDKKIKEYFNKI